MSKKQELEEAKKSLEAMRRIYDTLDDKDEQLGMSITISNCCQHISKLQQQMEANG